MSVPADWTAVEDALHSWVAAGSGLAATQVIWAQQSGPRPTGTWIAMRMLSLAPHGIDYLESADNPLSLADDDVESVDTGTNELTLTGHAYETGDGPVQLTTTGTLPAPLQLATDYWLEVVDANTVRIAASFPGAMNGVVIDLTDVGTGTHTISTTADSLRQGDEIVPTVAGGRIATLSLQCFAGDPTGSANPVAILDRVAAASKFPSICETLDAADVGLLSSGPATSLDGLIGESLFEPRAVSEHRLYLPLELADVAATIIEYVTVAGPDQTVSVPEDPT